jgi:hypothetical protein
MQDLNPLTSAGGAQLTDRGHIIEGMKRGHKIVILTPENKDTFQLTEDDFFVLSNISNFDPNRLGQLPNRRAVFHHDMMFRCKWRLYFPMTEKCDKDCPQGPIWKPVLEKALLHIFLSPLHYKVNAEYFGQAVEPHVLVPSTVDPDEFFDFRKPDRAGTCSLNGLISFKGQETNLEYARQHTEEKFVFAGTKDGDPQLPPNCSFVGPIADGRLPDFYNTFENYLELPNTPQPFNRTVAEAYLSGCKIKGNALVGALSWPWFTDRKTVAEKLRQAPADFWNALEQVL